MLLKRLLKYTIVSCLTNLNIFKSIKKKKKCTPPFKGADVTYRF